MTMEPGGRWITAEDASILNEAKYVIQLFQVCRHRWDREILPPQLPAVYESIQHQAKVCKASRPGYIYLVRSRGYCKNGATV